MFYTQASDITKEFNPEISESFQRDSAAFVSSIDVLGVPRPLRRCLERYYTLGALGRLVHDFVHGLVQDVTATTPELVAE